MPPPPDAEGRYGDQPLVWRGHAAAWPAVREWSLERLAALAPSMPVQLVVGNREHGASQFVPSTWGAHLASLARGASSADASPVRHLKEFDLLARLPELRTDVRTAELLPPHAVASHQVWLGPCGARTGLHYDLLDNVAVVLMGRKRFGLLAPGTVEALGHAARKYDQWARVSSQGLESLLRQGALRPDAVQWVDLAPGDALYVPRGWWHEVANLETSLLLSGFFGTRRRVWPLWLRTRARHGLHHLAWWEHGSCTCHAARPRAWPPAAHAQG